MFSPAVLDHFQNPRNPGIPDDATATVEVTNPVCGDILVLAVRTENNRISAAGFKARGCVTAMACASFVAEWLIGKTKQELKGIKADQISTALGGLPQASYHGSQLAADGVRAIADKLP